MSPTLGLGTDHDNIDDDVQTVNTNDTRAYMTPDGKCVNHPWVELRGKDLASGQVYQRESCPECNRQHETTMDDKRQRKLELDRQLRALGNENLSSSGVDVPGAGAGSRGSIDRDRVSESHSSHPQPYRPPLPPQSSSSSIDYSYPQRQSSPRPPTAAGVNNMMYAAPPGPSRTSSSASAASSSNQYQHQHQHMMDAITNGNGPLNNYANGTPTGSTLPFSPHSNPYDPQYLAAAAANAYHHANISPAPSQHLQQATRHDNQNQNQNDSLLWKLLQDKEDELKEVRKTLQETQRQFQEQSLLATKLQTTLDQVQASFEQERLLIKLQTEKKSQESLTSHQQEILQRQLQWMENNNNSTNINTDTRLAAQNLIKPLNDVGIGSSQHSEQNSIDSSGVSIQKQQQNDVGIGSSQHSDQNSIVSTAVSIGKMSISNDEEESQQSIHRNTNDREVVGNTEVAMVDAVSLSKSDVVTTNNDNNNITSSAKKKGEKKYPWTETTKVSPGREKKSTTLVADADDDDGEKEDANEANSNSNTFRIPTNSNSKKKLYPSIDETFMGSDVTDKGEAFTDDNNDLSKEGEASMPKPSSPSPKSTIREQLQQQHQHQHQQVPVDSIASRNTAQTINNMAETPTMNNTGRNSGKKTSINSMAETPTMKNTATRNSGKKSSKNDSSDRFEPLYVQQRVDEDEVATNTSDFTPPTDDDRSLGQTVASSTYGDDRMKVVGKTLLDPYGDKGTFTGVVLRNTGMPHGQGKMVYEEDLRVFDGEWRHGRWHGYGRASFSNGDSYEGEYKFDQRHGTGLYRWNDGRVYNGQFSEDKRHGKGKFTWPDGAVYDGDFVNGQRQGHGNYTFADGGQYEGSWKDGRYDGFGTCTWEDGRRYRGAWRNGMAHGQGTETYPNGNIRHEGQWIDDEPVRVKTFDGRN